MIWDSWDSECRPDVSICQEVVNISLKCFPSNSCVVEYRVDLGPIWVVEIWRWVKISANDVLYTSLLETSLHGYYRVIVFVIVRRNVDIVQYGKFTINGDSNDLVSWYV